MIVLCAAASGNAASWDDLKHHLDEHLQEMEHKWENIREFWPIVVKEFRERFVAKK